MCKRKYSGIQCILFVFKHFMSVTNSMSETFLESFHQDLTHFISAARRCSRHYKAVLQLSHPSDFYRKSVQNREKFIVVPKFSKLALISEPQIRKAEFVIGLII